MYASGLECLFDIEGHVALDRNPGPGYNVLLLRLNQGDLQSACPHRQFHTLPDLFGQSGCTANLLPFRLSAKVGESVCHFYDGLWYDPAGIRTHVLPHERRTRLPPSHPTYL